MKFLLWSRRESFLTRWIQRDLIHFLFIELLTNAILFSHLQQTQPKICPSNNHDFRKNFKQTNRVILMSKRLAINHQTYDPSLIHTTLQLAPQPKLIKYNIYLYIHDTIFIYFIGNANPSTSYIISCIDIKFQRNNCPSKRSSQF